MVSSPYQVLSAFEARCHFESSKNILIVSLPSCSDMVSSKQICEVVKRTSWDQVYYVYPQSSNKIFGVIKRWQILLRFLFLRKYKCGMFFIGDFRVQWKHYMRNMANPIKTILIDDGSASVNIFNNYLSKNIFYPNKSGVLKDAIEKILYFPFFLFGCPRDNISLFTSYDVSRDSDVEVIYNDFSNLKSLFSNSGRKINKEQVWFIGSPYSEKDILSFEYETEFLERCINWLKGKGLDVVYIAHRFDSDRKLDFVSRVCSAEVRRLRLPLEAHVLLEKEVPESIAAIYSSALETLPKVASFSEIYCFKLPCSDSVESISEIYCYYERVGVKVVIV